MVLVPTPRCTCKLPVEEAKSGIFTQKTLCDSASLSGMPFTVMLMRFISVPRMRMPVYPMPVPASEVTTVAGICSSRKGMSRPWLFFDISLPDKF